VESDVISPHDLHVCRHVMSELIETEQMYVEQLRDIMEVSGTAWNRCSVLV